MAVGLWESGDNGSISWEDVQSERPREKKEGGERSLHHEVTCTGNDFTLHDLVPLSVSQTHSPTLSLLSDRALAFVHARTHTHPDPVFPHQPHRLANTDGPSAHAHGQSDRA